MVPLQSLPKCFITVGCDDALADVLGDAVSTDIERDRGATARAWKRTGDWGFGFPVAPVTRIVDSDGGEPANPLGQAKFFVTRMVPVGAMMG